jgi:hypothetical protein
MCLKMSKQEPNINNFYLILRISDNNIVILQYMIKLRKRMYSEVLSHTCAPQGPNEKNEPRMISLNCNDAIEKNTKRLINEHSFNNRI